MCGHFSKKEETFAETMMASGSPTTIFLDVGYEPEFCKYICLLSIKTKRTLFKKVVGFQQKTPCI